VSHLLLFADEGCVVSLDTHGGLALGKLEAAGVICRDLVGQSV
jgi:hypothetical protein